MWQALSAKISSGEVSTESEEEPEWREYRQFKNRRQFDLRH
jgi:hypothetical protein